MSGGTIGRDEFIQLYIESVRQAVEANWPSRLSNVVFHSSGYDSRILSWTLRQLAEKHGRDWLGDVLFVCWGAECEGFAQIMEYEGWKPEQYRLIHNNGADVDSRHLHFKAAAHRLGGVVSRATNYWESGLHYLHQSLGGLKCVWTSQGNNEIWAIPNEQTFGEFYSWLYSCFVGEMFSAISWAVNCMPLNVHTLSLLLKHGPPCGLGSIRQDIVRTMDKGLAEIPRMDENTGQWMVDHRAIPADLFDKAIEDYRASWYGRCVAPEQADRAGMQTVLPSNWWRHWTAASLCDDLLRRGHKITVAA